MSATITSNHYQERLSRFQDRLSEAITRRLPSGKRININRQGHVYNSGDRDGAVYLVECGQVKTVTYSPDGKQCLLSIYTSGDVFGELCLVSDVCSETATAMRPTVLQRIPVAVFRRILVDEKLLEAFLGHLAIRLSEQQEVIKNMVTMDSERRLAATLLMLGRKLGKRHQRGIRIDYHITQEELSGMVGTTRSRVGYFLKRFCEAGLVYRGPGAPLVIDERSLSAYLEMST